MTVLQALAYAKSELGDFDSPNLEVEILLRHTLKKNLNFVFANPDHKLPFRQLRRFKKLVRKRAQNIPSAYLTGHKEFYGLDFFVNKNVLIPRPETELIVESALNEIKKLPITHYSSPITLIDLGTGCGCIPISILKNQLTKNKIIFFATDISEKALRVARKNARLHTLAGRIKFIKSDLLTTFLNVKMFRCLNAKMILTANLPYLPEKIYRQNYASLKYEPKNSLLAGQDGLKYYRRLLAQLKSILATYNLQLTAFLEIDPSQTSKIKKIINFNLPNAAIEIIKDLSGKNRVVKFSTS